MKSFPLIAVVWVGLSVSTHADLGDNDSQLVARYGPAVGSKTTDKPGYMAVTADRLSFKMDNTQTDALLFEGVVEEESVYHRPYSPLSDAEIKALLKANQQGQSWTTIPAYQEPSHWLETQQSWKRTDGTIASVEGPKGQPRMLFHIKSKKLSDAEQKTR
jgi:hypothetical protein